MVFDFNDHAATCKVNWTGVAWFWWQQVGTGGLEQEQQVNITDWLPVASGRRDECQVMFGRSMDVGPRGLYLRGKRTGCLMFWGLSWSDEREHREDLLSFMQKISRDDRGSFS
jgi:hypothetical protein